jgi:DNA-binding HxlR family transcriptional regulator
MKEFDYKQLDDIVHGRIRLAIMSFLISTGEAEFSLLKSKLKATDGNLSVHLRKLEDAGYISVAKEFINRKPISTYVLTAKGKKAFSSYIERLEHLIKRP